MTLYKCKHECTFELDDDVADDLAIDIIDANVRAYCAFCEHKDHSLITWNEDASMMEYTGDLCTWIREDQSWDDWDRDQVHFWNNEDEEEGPCTGDCKHCPKVDEWQVWDA